MKIQGESVAVSVLSYVASRSRVVRGGFALPTILIASVVMLMVLLVSVSSTATVRTAIKNQYYQQLAQVAGEAGIAYAEACLAANGNVPLWSDASPLRPNTNCSGVETVSCPTTSVNPLCSVTLNDTVRSSFSIGAPDIKNPSVMVVAGGGGGESAGSGGGGGGYIDAPELPLEVGTYTVTIGGGGTGGVWAVTLSSKGGNSVFGTLTAEGGGGGVTHSNPGLNGGNGGSGGGGAMSTNTPFGFGGTSSQGNNGGNGFAEPSNWNGTNGGGGGAGGVGASGSSVSGGGNGGAGISNSITGAAVVYASGGGAGEINGSFIGTGGTSAGSGVLNSAGTNAIVNRGGGGGGGSFNGAYTSGGSGGSGIVVVNYPTGSLTATGGLETISGNNTIRTFTGSGTFQVTALSAQNGTIPNTGFVELLRDSTRNVYKRYDQKSAPAAVIPDLCSNATKSIFGWSNASVRSATYSIPALSADAIGVNLGNTIAGATYFRKDFSVTTAGTYTLTTASSNTVDWYVDGRFVLNRNSTAPASVSVSLTAGCHSLVVRSTNRTVLPSQANFRGSLTASGATLPLVVTDSSWRVSSSEQQHYSMNDYYADIAFWGAARQVQHWGESTVWAPASMIPAWNTTSQDLAANWLSTTHSFTGGSIYPSNSNTVFRDENKIVLSASTPVRLTYTCDDICDIYLNGTRVVQKTSSWTSLETTNLTLSEGAHTFGIMLRNGSGASGLIFSVMRLSDSTILTNSNATSWRAAPAWYPNDPQPFSYSSTFNPNPSLPAVSTAQLLVVGGGGAGGGSAGTSIASGGGGGGGVVHNAAYVLTTGNYPVTVGPGGAGVVGFANGSNGSSSSFDTVVAYGGGGGGSWTITPRIGASGGASSENAQALVGASGIFGQGFRGGNGFVGYDGGATSAGGGGGGAGGVGTNSTGNTTGGAGGIGISNAISGVALFYGGGGGGAGNAIAGVGGSAVGGAGRVTTTGPGVAGTISRGGGGGGALTNAAEASQAGGAGGNGIVIVRYPTGSLTAIGGTITTSGSFTIHTFTGGGTFSVTSIP